MKIVLDTNVLISALLWQGPSHKLIIMVENKTFSLCLTPILLEELSDVLNRPKFSCRIKELNTSSEELLAGVINIAELYPDRKIESVVKEDADDDKVLSCALTAGAKYIISGDFHLLKLKQWAGITISTPQSFLNLISKL